MFSKACEYAINAVIFIARETLEEKRSNLKQIASAIHSPEAYTAKILQQLVHSHLIQSLKGPHGGFFVDTPKLQTLNLWQIVYAIDGDGLASQCALGLRQCSETNPCPIHPQYRIIKSNMLNMLGGNLIIDLVKDLNNHNSYLMN